MQLTPTPLSRRALLGGLCALPLWAQAGFKDPLDTPALMRSEPGQRPLLALANVGTGLVGVGSRGLIVLSADRGRTWTQRPVPAQSDLLALHFTSPTQGWVVGHDGLVLHSADGGQSWVRQLDGRTAKTAFEAYYQAAGAGSEAALAQVKRNYGNGPMLPFLDVWFDNPTRGYIVGSFGQIAATQDGGKTWEPWLHRIDNPEQLNLNAIRRIAGELYIAGERGQVYQLDAASGRFVAQDTGYNGSFFGLAGHAHTLLAFGLRGVVYRSEPGGNGRWSRVAIPVEQTLTAGLYDPEIGFVLLNASGDLLLGGEDGLHWRVLAPPQPLRAAGLTLRDSHAAVVAALDGVHVSTLPAAPPRPPPGAPR